MVIWLNLLTSVDDSIYGKYKFGCYAIAISCIIEVTAEAPVFLAQVYCFVKLKVILDTAQIFIRSVTFIYLVLRDPDEAIFAFGVAQLAATLTIVVGYFGYFYVYIRQLKHTRGEERVEPEKEEPILLNRRDSIDDEPDDLPFTSILELCPGVLANTVR